MNRTIVHPQIVDGVEFFVSDNTNETGMSIAGLARLCGVDSSGLCKLLEKVQSESGTCTVPKPLKACCGKVFNSGLAGYSGGTQAKIVRSEVCAAVVEYYAFESKARNDVAQHTYRRFAAKGIDVWIKEVTGSVQQQDNQALMGAMQQILGQLQSLTGEVHELKAIAHKYENIRGATITNFPGLNEMLDDFEASDKILPQAEDEVTLTQWLATKGITFDPNVKMRFGNIVSATYATLTGSKPRKARCKDKHGRFTEKQNVYKPCHYPILEVALKQMF